MFTSRPYTLQLIRGGAREACPTSPSRKRRRGSSPPPASSDIEETTPPPIAGPSRTSSSGSTQRRVIRAPTSPRKRPASRRAVSSPLEDEGEPEHISSAEILTSSDYTSCPICTAEVQISRMDRHIDRGCPPPSPPSRTNSGTRNLKTSTASIAPSSMRSNPRPGPPRSTSGEKSAKAQWSSIMGGGNAVKSRSLDSEEPLPKVSYATLKDKAIKALLVEQRLPVTGDKVAWIARHSRSV
jgi:hypothetical protein